MQYEVLTGCWPYGLALLASVAALRVLVWLSGARWCGTRLAGLHHDQAGAVQSLSFVLTLPIFIIILLFIVQISQLTIGRVVLEYAAFAAARSAIVWIPANLGPGDEQENRIGRLRYLGAVLDEDGNVYSEYEVEPEGPKYRKIHFAAAMACMPISPSRSVGQSRMHPGNSAADPLIRLYHAYAPEAIFNARIPARIRNKLAYALNNTHVRIVIRHKDEEPELIRHGLGPYPEEFTGNEIGWQDQILVTVTHDFALLPGPGTILARPASTASSAPSTQRVAQRIGRSGTVFTYPVRGTVRLGNEGEKPVLPYLQRIYQGSPQEPEYPDNDYPGDYY